MIYKKTSLTAGFEPATFRLTVERSTNWATRAYDYLKYIMRLKPASYLVMGKGGAHGHSGAAVGPECRWGGGESWVSRGG